MKLSKETIEYLDSLSDAEFIYFLHLNYSAKIPQWKECSRKEYEKYCGKFEDKITIDLLEHLIDNMCNGREYRRVPFWNEGGGIMDQISGREPDGYRYEKCTGYKNTLMLGSGMIEYCQTRECMKPYFEEDT